MKRIDQLNQTDIEYHLRSAVDSLVPDVFDKINLDAPQDAAEPERKIAAMRRWGRTASTAAAACLVVLALAGGAHVYSANRVDSVIGIDVNPSIELSVNRRNRVLEAEALNADAENILDDMELENVDLNVALNAVIGSMVQKGYLDDMDNAILVTVANDDAEKAADIRAMVVGDIETSLQENQVEAVVYNQRAVTTDEVQQLADQYGISYGKAYFLQELIDQNEALSEADMEKFAAMTMEEIAREITESAYDLGEDVEPAVDVTLPARESEPQTRPGTSAGEPGSGTEEAKDAGESAGDGLEHADGADGADGAGGDSTGGNGQGSGGAGASGSGNTSVPVLPTVTEPSSSEEETQSSAELGIKIDYVDYDDGVLDIVFKSRVKWKNATISVYDGNGDSYSARILDTGSTSCSVRVSGLPGDEECTFVIGGVALRNGGSFGTVKGYFDTPYISPDAGEESTAGSTEAETGETAPSEESAGSAGESSQESSPAAGTGSDENGSGESGAESSQETGSGREDGGADGGDSGSEPASEPAARGNDTDAPASETPAGAGNSGL